MIRKAEGLDIKAIASIYDKIIDDESQGKVSIGWEKGVYPTEATAIEGLQAGELFVAELNGKIVAAARINQVQVPVYKNATWDFPVDEKEVMVLHTLVVDPDIKGKGIGKKFVKFYEEYALENGCHYLRMDTNMINKGARGLYKNLGYKEVGIVDCVFNGIAGVKLVCLEKKI